MVKNLSEEMLVIIFNLLYINYIYKISSVFVIMAIPDTDIRNILRKKYNYLTDLKLFEIILMLGKDQQQTHGNSHLGHIRTFRILNICFIGIFFFTLSSLSKHNYMDGFAIVSDFFCIASDFLVIIIFKRQFYVL